MHKRRISRIFISLATSALMMKAYAVAPGFYFGLAMGPASNTADKVAAQVAGLPGTQTLVSTRSKQFGSRLFMGYQMNDYVGVEGGFNFFSSIHYDNKGVNTCSSLSSHVRDIDIEAKGSMPFYSFSLIGKAGMAATYLTTSGAFNTAEAGALCGRSTHVAKFSPLFAIGASYDLTQSWVAEFTWTRILVGNIVNNVDFYGLGISYHFVDRYCGQFLCDD